MSSHVDAPAAAAATSRPLVPGGGVAAVAGSLALAITNGLVAASQDRATSTADVVRSSGEQQGLTELTIGLGLVTGLLLVPGIWSTGSLLARRAPVAAGIGTWLAASGYALFAVLAVEAAVALGVARAVLEDGLDPAAYVAGVDQHGSVALVPAYVVFGLGALVGVVVLGVAVLRQAGDRGPLPRWAGWALVLSPLVRTGGLVFEVAAGPALASLMMAAGFAGVLLALRRSGTGRA